MTNVPFVKFLPVFAVLFASALSLASAQTAPAPPAAPTSAAPASSAPAHPTGQIVPGATGTISPAQGVTPATVAKTKANKILNGALTPKTRQTLQEAMNAVTPQPAVTNAPPAAAGH